ncbi:MAG: ABC transporter ATP-binding protein [Bacteroidales bacterium]|nr:ABC transporter ATP-binding protein [Bacteroidales bacterium]
MATAIEFSNISKIYRLGMVSTGTLAHDLKRWWTMNIRHQEDPFLTIGETNDRSTKGESEYVWALKDIDFKVEQGDVVGIIGKNGAGKSTLLKILSKVTAPTTGTIRARGRIGSLLEVGTGFHPEMTGRENIYMNGAILGMKKDEISRKLDEIIDFSGCERYIDTPVKRYSSGMMVRLGFAVAAHLDPEILVVDEVLAVGDAEFQKKAIGKMQDVSHGEGRTVLFVSHNMDSIRQLCNNCILIENGSIIMNGETSDVILHYLEHNQKTLLDRYDTQCESKISANGIELLELKIVDKAKNDYNGIIRVTDRFGFYIRYKINQTVYKPDLSFLISTEKGEKVFHSVYRTDNYSDGEKTYIAWIPGNLLNSLNYMFTLGITTSNPVKIHINHSIRFTVSDDYNSPTRRSNYRDYFHGVVRPDIQWEESK